jgi:hypothetical protein
MNTQMQNSKDKVIRQTLTILFVLLAASASVFGQGNELRIDRSVIESDWWNSLLKGHNIDLKKFNYINTFSLGTDTISNLWLEMGISDTLTGKIVHFRDAIIISRTIDQPYAFMTFQDARHDFENQKLTLLTGHWATYDFNFKEAIPLDTASVKEILVDIRMNSISFTDFRNIPNPKK